MSSDVLIIGSGIVGNALAYYLCRQGIKPTVLESDRIGHGGSSRNGGGVRQSARDPRELPLMMWGVKHIWPTLSDELGVDTEYTQKGNLRLGKTEANRKKLETLTAKCNAVGLDMVMLSQKEAQAVLPYMSDEVTCAGWCPTDGHANPLTTTLGYYYAARSLGARFITGERAVSLKTKRGKIDSAVTANGTVYTAGTIVVCAGFESRELLNTVGIDIPMNLRQIECFVTEMMPPMFEQMLGVADADFYGHQSKHGSFVMGGNAGFANFPMQHNARHTPTSMAVTPSYICRSILRYFPMLKDCKIVRSWAGWEDVTPDGVPAIGKIDEIPGLYTACGFCGHGFGIGPAVSHELADLIANNHTTIDLSQLHYSRFRPVK